MKYLRTRHTKATLLAGVAFCCLIHLSSPALEESGLAGNLAYRIFAPDWTWQNRDINILLVLTNQDESEALQGTIELLLPEGLSTHFSYKEATSLNFDIEARQTQRQAFTEITALPGFPLQDYVFSLVLRSGEEEIRVPYAVRTIRGALVHKGHWGVLLIPVGLSLLWSLIFVSVLRGFAKPGAWSRPSETIAFSEEETP
jgi:hypothetical protein